MGSKKLQSVRLSCDHCECRPRKIHTIASGASRFLFFFFFFFFALIVLKINGSHLFDCRILSNCSSFLAATTVLLEGQAAALAVSFSISPPHHHHHHFHHFLVEASVAANAPAIGAAAIAVSSWCARRRLTLPGHGKRGADRKSAGCVQREEECGQIGGAQALK